MHVPAPGDLPIRRSVNLAILRIVFCSYYFPRKYSYFIYKVTQQVRKPESVYMTSRVYRR